MRLPDPLLLRCESMGGCLAPSLEGRGLMAGLRKLEPPEEGLASLADTASDPAKAAFAAKLMGRGDGGVGGRWEPLSMRFRRDFVGEGFGRSEEAEMLLGLGVSEARNGGLGCLQMSDLKRDEADRAFCIQGGLLVISDAHLHGQKATLARCMNYGRPCVTSMLCFHYHKC